jgi:hypothetical protein
MSFNLKDEAVTRGVVLEPGSLIADIVMKKLFSPRSVLVEDACLSHAKQPARILKVLAGRAFALLDIRVRDESTITPRALPRAISRFTDDKVFYYP